MRMNFGKILEQWEKRCLGEARPKSGRGQKGGESPAAFQKRWVASNPVVNKDTELEAESARNRRRRRRRMRAQESLDLHLLTRAEAWAALEAFFVSARRRGLEKVLIIHGKGTHSESGEAVLRDMCKSFLEQCEYAGESGPADKTHGGNGATWVILK